MADEPDRAELLSALTTEHFTLQGARAQTAGESASRTSLFMLSVSSTLVALGFLGQGSRPGHTFEVFALTVLPTLYLLGVVTFVRVVECGAEDYRYGVAINRIRHYYKDLAGEQERLFLLSGHDDGPGVFGNMAVPVEGRRQFFSFASVVAVIDSVIGGSTVAIAIATVLDGPLAVSAPVGGVVGVLSLVLLLRHADRLLERRAGGTESIFPTPQVLTEDGSARFAGGTDRAPVAMQLTRPEGRNVVVLAVIAGFVTVLAVFLIIGIVVLQTLRLMTGP